MPHKYCNSPCNHQACKDTFNAEIKELDKGKMPRMPAYINGQFMTPYDVWVSGIEMIDANRKEIERLES